MQKKFIYIINPISGSGTKKGLQDLIREKTKEKNIPFYIFPSVANGDYSYLHPLIKEQNITDVIIAGGDGTVSQVVSSLLKFDLNFGVIPSGSGNGLALFAGISKQPEKALNTIFNGTATAIDGFYVNDQFACMLCGLGFDAKVAHDFAKQPKRGFAMYIRQTILNLLSAKTFSFELQMKNVKLETDAYFISIANSNQFGNNFTIAPRASLNDGLLDVVIVTSGNTLNFILQTLRQVAGWNQLQSETHIENKKSVIYFQTDRLTIINKTNAPFHIDGDPAESVNRVKIKVFKNCFRLIQP